MAKMIYEVLEREHRMVTDLLQRAQRAGASEREDLLEQAMQELISHSEAESETFYAALRDHDETRDLVDEAESEHQQVAVLLDGIDHAADDDGAVQNRIQELIEAVEHHVQEEERELFARARSVLDEDQARELAERFREIKASVTEEELAPEDLLEPEE
jgi:hemerythrin superfamily protein